MKTDFTPSRAGIARTLCHFFLKLYRVLVYSLIVLGASTVFILAVGFWVVYDVIAFIINQLRRILNV